MTKQTPFGLGALFRGTCVVILIALCCVALSWKLVEHESSRPSHGSRVEQPLWTIFEGPPVIDSLGMQIPDVPPDLNDTAIITMASGSGESARHAVALLQSLRDAGTRVATLLVLLPRGSIGSNECNNFTLKAELNRTHIDCRGPDTVENEIVDTVYLEAFKRLGAETLIIDPIPDNPNLHISGGRDVWWGQAFNKLKIFGMSLENNAKGLVQRGFRRILYMDSDTFALRNLDHLFGLPTGRHHSSQIFGCADPGKPLSAEPGSGLVLLDPSEDRMALLDKLYTNPVPYNATRWGQKWVIGDQAVLAYAHTAIKQDIDVIRVTGYEPWPATQSDIHGLVKGLEYLPYWRDASPELKLSHFDNITSKWKLDYVGLVEERWREAYADGHGPRPMLKFPWEPLDVRYDYHLQTCERFPGMMPTEIRTLHFTCNRYVQ
jgi:hypothetical protein